MTADADGIQWIHRKDGEADIYFVANAKDSTLTTTLTLSLSGRIPEIWDPETGTWSMAETWTSAEGMTQVRLQLTTRRAVFLVLREQTTEQGPGLMPHQPASVEEITLNNPWAIKFDDGKTAE